MREGISSGSTLRISSAARATDSGRLSRLPTNSIASKMVRGLKGQEASPSAGLGEGDSAPGGASAASTGGGAWAGSSALLRRMGRPRLAAHHLGERLGQLVERDAPRLRREGRVKRRRHGRGNLLYYK